MQQAWCFGGLLKQFILHRPRDCRDDHRLYTLLDAATRHEHADRIKEDEESEAGSGTCDLY